MATTNEYTKFENDTDTFWTCPASGHLYAKIAHFEGLDSKFITGAPPLISVEVVGDDACNDGLNSNLPNNDNSYADLMLSLKSRSYNVKVTFKDPDDQSVIGVTLIEPTRLGDLGLQSVWYPISPSARALIVLFWATVSTSHLFTNSLNRLSGTRLMMKTSKTYYTPGETIRGMVVYRPQQKISIKTLQLTCRFFSTQNFHDDSIFNPLMHEYWKRSAIMLTGDAKAATEVEILPGCYTWSFEFPLPYNMAPTGFESGNICRLEVEEIAKVGRISLLRTEVDIVKVFFPSNILAPAMNGVVVVPPTITRLEDTIAESEVGIPMDADVERSKIIDMFSDTSDDDDTKAKASTKPTKASKANAKGKRKNSNERRSSEDSLSTDDSYIPDMATNLEDSIVSFAPSKTSPSPQRADSKMNSHSAFDQSISGTSPPDKTVDFGSVKKPLSPRDRLKENQLVVPLRVIPGLHVSLRPSSGKKHLVLPLSIENTTSKPLVKLFVELKQITVRLLVTNTPGFTKMHLDTFNDIEQYTVRRWKLKKESGWPILPGTNWTGKVTLSLKEHIPPSVEAYNSPIFQRYYLFKIRATPGSRHLFGSKDIKQKIPISIGSYDFDTRPLPQHHLCNIPMVFSVTTIQPSTVGRASVGVISIANPVDVPMIAIPIAYAPRNTSVPASEAAEDTSNSLINEDLEAAETKIPKKRKVKKKEIIEAEAPLSSHNEQEKGEATIPHRKKKKSAIVQ